MIRVPAFKYQENIWVLDHLTDQKEVFSNSVFYRFDGASDLQLLELSIKRIFESYQKLFARFEYDNGNLEVSYVKSEQIPFPYDFQLAKSDFSQEALIKAFKNFGDFDLEQKHLLFSIRIVQFSDNTYVLGLGFHDVLMNSQFARNLVYEVVDFYTKTKNDQEYIPCAVDCESVEELIERVEWEQSQEYNDMLLQWQKEFPNQNEKLELPSIHKGLREFNYEGKRKKIPLKGDVFKVLIDEANRSGILMEQYLFSAFSVLMHRLSGQDNVVIGCCSGRLDFGTKFGDADNILPLRVDFTKSPSLIELAEQIKDSIYFEKGMNRLPFSSLVENSEGDKDLGINPFYQTAIIYREIKENSNLEILLEEVFIDRNGAKLDFSFEILRKGNNFEIIVGYNSRLIDDERLTQWMAIFEKIIEAFGQDIHSISDEIKLISDEEAASLCAWNKTECAYEDHLCIHNKLEDSAMRFPDNIAIEWETGKMKYEQLNAYANQFANFLQIEKGIKDGIVGISMDRSPEMIIAIMGILKAGAAYLPIDVASPIDRTKAILADSKPHLLITKRDSSSPIEGLGVEVMMYDKYDQIIDTFSDKSPVKVSSDSLAYVIYTSGSTGAPKGVMIKHHSVLNRIAWMQKAYPISSDDVLLQKTPVTFDVSVWELFWWTFTGAKLVLLAKGAEKEPALLCNAIEKYQVTTLHFVPSMFGAFRYYIDGFSRQNQIESIRTIFLSGEALPVEYVNDFYSLLGGESDIQLINLYGPTEATVDVSHFKCEQNNRNQFVYIGQAIDNTKLHVVNRKNILQPIGVKGELVIEGVNLAVGYLNNAELSSNKFIEIEVLEGLKKRVYKTGDLVKWTEKGDVDYIGRLDNQVKIRGFRIELGEVEAALMEYAGTENCAVVVDRSNTENPILIAYLQHQDAKLDVPEIKEFLSQKLPEYMIPTFVYRIQEMPLNSSGKIDRKSLKPDDVQKASGITGSADTLEGIIQTVWENVLKIEDIETNANFFDLGGNSIMIPHVAAQLKKEHNIKINTIDIFQYPTIESLSAFIAKDNEGRSDKKIKRIDGDQDSKKSRSHDIAIVGLAGKFPASDDKDDFWDNLLREKECLSFFDDDILAKVDSTYEKHKDNPDYIKSRGILNDVDQWDPGFFGFSPHDAKHTDPQQRLWFETVWNAFEDAGIDPYSYQGDVGVFAGVNLNSYLFDNILRNRVMYEDYMHFSDAETFHTYVNNDPAFIATRTAYLFNLRGPAINIQTACSTALTATIQACNSIASGESDMAIAGASSVQTPQEIGYVYQAGNMRSADGHCSPFDKNANGTVFSNAVGAVVLKRLEAAERDGDDIYGVIRGWALNNDGNDKIGFAAPSINGQINLLQKAQKMAQIHPEDFCYIEAHGTGTILGDPIETSALFQAFGNETDKKQFCGLGSVKGNVGHTDEVAGMVGLVKVAMAAKEHRIPATINFTEANPNIDFENSPFYVVDKEIKWEENRPMIMGVSSFGVGGTNAHIIIEDYQRTKRSYYGVSEKPQIVVASAKSKKSLENNIQNLIHFQGDNPNCHIHDIAYTTQLRRTHFSNKAFAIIENGDFLNNESFVTGSHNHKTKRTVFLFPGQGAQYVNMGLPLYEEEPVFKGIVDEGFAIYEGVTGGNLKDIVYPNEGSGSGNLISHTKYTQPALFIISYATAKVYEKYGIKPDYSIGHSIGEYVSACVAGIFDFETALKIVIRRGQLMQSAPTGSMLAVRAGEDKLSTLNTDLFEIAALNAPESSTISYKTQNKEAIETLLKMNEIGFIPLKTSHAFHSADFDGILVDFENYISQFQFNEPKIQFISCLSGDYVDKTEVTSPAYYARQLRNTVMFDKGISKIQENADCVFIEVGPNTHLTGIVRQNRSITSKTRIIASLGKENEGKSYKNFLQSIGNVWLAGIRPDFDVFHEGRNPEYVKLPGYAFDKKRYWIDVDRKIIQKNIEKEETVFIETEVTDEGEAGENYFADKLDIPPLERELLKIWSKSLGTDEIESEDNFFDLGGHSLLAVQILDTVKERLKAVVSLEVFLDHPTVSELVKIIEGEAKVENVAVEANIIVDLSKIPLSTSQRRIWILSNVLKTNPAYNVPYLYRLEGRVDQTILIKSIETVLKRQVISFSEFFQEDGEPYYKVEPREITIEFLDYSIYSEREKYSMLNDLVRETVRKPFDVNTDLLFKFKIVKTRSQGFYLLAVFHHLIFDGWSWWVFINDFNSVYRSYLTQEPVDLPQIKKFHYDYALLNSNSLSAGREEECIAFWRGKLENIPTAINFPFDYSRPRITTGYGGKSFFKLSKDDSIAMREISKQHNSTLFISLLSAFSIIMHKYSGDEDICIGTYISDRPGDDFRNTFGMFVHTLVLRLGIDPGDNFPQLLSKVRKETFESMTYQDFGFEKIVEAVNPARQANVNPIFQVVFVWHADAFAPITQDLFKGEKVSIDEGVSPFDITFNMWDNDGIIEGDVEYNTDILSADTVDRLKNNFLKLINEIVVKRDVCIEELSVVSGKEKKIQAEFNKTDIESPENLLQELFENQVSITPNSIAVETTEEVITYEELNIRANQLANYLLSTGVSQGDFVGLSFNRSVEMVVSLLGVLKTGACYLPLDPDFPTDRIEYMLQNSGAMYLLTEKDLTSKYSDISTDIIFIEEHQSEISNQDILKPDISVDPDALAYIIYTSGSTGKPKGVKVQHEAVVNFINSMKRVPGMSAEDSLLAVTTLSFDISVLEMFLPLACGARVIVANSNEVNSGKVLIDLLETKGVSIMQATPATWSILIESGWKGNENFKALCGGEAISEHLIEHLLPKVGELWNMYGPTETTVWSTCSQIMKAGEPIVVGKPIDNTSIYILDRNNKIKPFGTIGEVAIGGKGVSKGYHLRDELTEEKFVSIGKEMVYKTGDFGKVRYDGMLEIIGRIDNQIKLRGFRIEPGEVETGLETLDGVKEAVVKVVKYSELDERLVAFMVCEDGFSMKNTDISAALSLKLPMYMIPVMYKVMKAFPRTPNGKIQRSELQIGLEEYSETTKEEVISSDLEKDIYSIFCEGLNIESFSLNDNFFNIGGNSILLVKVAATLNEKLNLDMDVIDLFQYPTVRSLSKYISPEEKEIDNQSSIDDRAKKRQEMQSAKNRRRR